MNFLQTFWEKYTQNSSLLRFFSEFDYESLTYVCVILLSALRVCYNIARIMQNDQEQPQPRECPVPAAAGGAQAALVAPDPARVLAYRREQREEEEAQQNNVADAENGAESSDEDLQVVEDEHGDSSSEYSEDEEELPREMEIEVLEDSASDYGAIDSDPDWTDDEGFSLSQEQNRTYTDQLLRLIKAKFERKSYAVYKFQPLKLMKVEYTKDNFSQYPCARSGHRVIASESHLYSLGGYNPASAMEAARMGECLLFQQLWSFNFATQEWRLLLQGNRMPTELVSNALAICNDDTLICHGGTGYPFGEVCSNDCYIYKTGEQPECRRLDVTGDLPAAQYGPGIVLHEHYLYTIGGTTGFDYSCDVCRLDLKTGIWQNMYICRPELRDDPEGRYRHEVVYDGKHIFVLGGGTAQLVFDLQKIPAFNLETNQWDYFETQPDGSMLLENPRDKLAGFPKPRKCFSCVQQTLSNGDIEAFITGGLQGDFTTYFADIWKLNLRTMQWTCIRTAVLPKPLYFHSAAHANNGCMYIFAGIEYNNRDMRRRNRLYKMWMTIPKLSEICWEALNYFHPDLATMKRDHLLEQGVPIRFVKRLPASTN